MPLAIFALVMAFSFVFFFISHKKAYGLAGSMVLLGLTGILYCLLILYVSPPLPVLIILDQADVLEGIELTATACVSLGDLSPESQGALLEGPQDTAGGERIPVFAPSLQTASYTFRHDQTSYSPGDEVWIRYALRKATIQLIEVKPVKSPELAGAGGVLFLALGLLRAFRRPIKRKTSLE